MSVYTLSLQLARCSDAEIFPVLKKRKTSSRVLTVTISGKKSYFYLEKKYNKSAISWRCVQSSLHASGIFTSSHVRMQCLLKRTSNMRTIQCCRFWRATVPLLWWTLGYRELQWQRSFLTHGRGSVSWEIKFCFNLKCTFCPEKYITNRFRIFP